MIEIKTHKLLSYLKDKFKLSDAQYSQLLKMEELHPFFSKKFVVSGGNFSTDYTKQLKEEENKIISNLEVKLSAQILNVKNLKNEIKRNLSAMPQFLVKKDNEEFKKVKKDNADLKAQVRSLQLELEHSNSQCRRLLESLEDGLAAPYAN